MLHSPERPQALSRNSLLFFLQNGRTTNHPNSLPAETFTTANLHITTRGENFGVQTLALPYLDVNKRFAVVIKTTLCK